MTNFNQSEAKQTSIVEFRHIDGTIQGGVVGGTFTDTFNVTSKPRYGDTKSHTFRYEEVAEIISSTPRTYVNLPAFRL